MKNRLSFFAILFLVLIVSCNKGTTELLETVTIDGSVGKLVGDIARPATEFEKIPVCIYFHGLTGCRNEEQIDALSDSLFNNGIGFVRFDFNGHGESDGDFVNMNLDNELEDAEMIYNYVASLPWVNPNKIAVAGHSQGGLIGSLLSSKLGKDKIKCLLLYAPAANIPFDVKNGNMFEQQIDPENLPDWIPFWKGKHLGKSYLESALRLLDLYERIKAYEGPVCVIQGTNDTRTLIRYNGMFRRIYKSCEYHTLEGVSHCFPEALDTQANLGMSFILNSFNAPLSIKPDTRNGLIFTGEGQKTLNLLVNCGKDTKTSVEVNFVQDTTLTLPVQDTVYSFVKQSVKVKDGTTTILPVNFDLKPGIYQVRADYLDGKEMKQAGFFNIAVNPEQICSPQDKQPDFDSFWDETLSELAKIPLEPKMTLLKEYSDTNRNVYLVEMKSFGGELMGGVVAIPVKPGKYPAYISYQGYSENPSYYRGASNPGAIEMHVSVREQGLYKDKSSIKDHWMEFGLQSKETYFYRGAYCDIKRAVEFIASLDQTDPERIFARGDSQGAGFSMIAAALDSRIRAIAIGVPFLGDFCDYWKIVEWPMEGVFKAGELHNVSRESILKTLTYFDAKNFADRITCDVYMGFCLQDPTCPPHTNFATYNLITSKKEYFGVAEGKHDIWERDIWNNGKKEFFERYD